MFRLFAAVLSLAASAAGGPQGPSSAVPPVTAASINAAAPNGANDKDPSLIAKAETLLDRAHFSPGAIDGLDGDNFRSASAPFRRSMGWRSPETSTQTPGISSHPATRCRS